LVETDSPYLAPPPHRGKTNEPGFTRYVLNRLAEIKGISEGDMASQTRTNTLALFDQMKPQQRAGVW
jgi:TatD DNase family protein